MRDPTGDSSTEGSSTWAEEQVWHPRLEFLQLWLWPLRPIGWLHAPQKSDTLWNAAAPCTQCMQCVIADARYFRTGATLRHPLNPPPCSFESVLTLLQLLFEAGMSASSINIYMAAILSCWDFINGSSQGTHHVLLLKGVRRLWQHHGLH